MLLLISLQLYASEIPTQIIVTSDNKMVAYNSDQNSQRIYPYADTLQPLLGYTNSEGKGITGFEQVADFVFERNLNIKLTINFSLQQKIETLIESYKYSLKADEIIVGVMESNTGYVRAFASSNRFDPYALEEKRAGNYWQKFTAYRYEPGAVMMPLVMAAAYERNFIDKSSLITVNNGKLELDNGRFITDSTKNDLLTPEGILLNMSNIGIAKIAYRFSGFEFRESMERFGLTQDILTELGDRSEGWIQPAAKLEERMYRANTSYGYGMLASFHQFLYAYSAFNNEGVPVKPVLIHSLFNDGEESYVLPIEPQERAISPQSTQNVKDLLVANVQKGLAQKARYPGLETGGMGSTAYIAKNGHYVKEYHSSFYGFANDADGHKYTIGVLVIRPRDAKKFYASQSAVPVFGKVVEEMVWGSMLVPVKK